MLVPRMFILFINIWVNIITSEAAFPSKDLLRKSYGKRPTLDWRAYLEKNLLDEMEVNKTQNGNIFDKWCHPFSEKLVEILTTEVSKSMENIESNVQTIEDKSWWCEEDHKYLKNYTEPNQKLPNWGHSCYPKTWTEKIMPRFFCNFNSEDQIILMIENNPF